MKMALLAVVITAAGLGAQLSKMMDTQIRQALIQESIPSYRGSAAPLCYERDVTSKMVDDYRARR